MPPKTKFNKEVIVEAAFEIAKEKGFAGITARSVAERLDSSVAPIYVNFVTIDDLITAVVKRVFTLSEELLANQKGENLFENIGKASLEFARLYPVFFRELLLKPNPPEDYPVASEVRISLGYAGSADHLPRTLRFPIAEPFNVNGSTIDRLQLTNYNYEPAFAPEGHTLLSCTINQFHDDYDAWDALAKDPEAYRQEKERIGEAVLRAIETRFTQMKGKLKLLDVATPKTFERYCNSYRGAIVGFVPTIRAKGMTHTGRVKGLDNIQLSGQWLYGTGGLPPALITGKHSIMRLCKREKQPFVHA